MSKKQHVAGAKSNMWLDQDRSVLPDVYTIKNQDSPLLVAS